MKRWLWLAAGAILFAGAVVGVVAYTERPSFCGTCHEMRPYLDAWRDATHSDVSCLECHVDEGLGNRVAHKFVALKEVWIHITSNPLFPDYPTDVPDTRCVRCHETIDPDEESPGFSHDEHAAVGACQGCHPSTGHEVSFDALRQEHSLDESVAEEATRPVSGVLHSADATPAPLAEHADVSCDACHDMSRGECAYCHASPEGHFEDVACAECHPPGVEFSEAQFEHRGKLDCRECHKPPADHFAGIRCDRCHSPDAEFEKPKFDHEGKLDCADCHKPPANHFGGLSCSRCHASDVPFDEASFRHPGVGDEHSYRSFPCADCHPSGYGSASCAKCHEGGTPDD